MPSNRILLVEGIADQYFFFELLKVIIVSADVRVSAPKDLGGTYNTKGGVFNMLPILVRQMNDGKLDRIAAVVDADHEINNGMGYTKTLEKFSLALAKEGFTKRERVGEQGGFRFLHEDGLNPVGLWIMPDNKSNGGLEEWVLQSSVAAEDSALSYAMDLLTKIPGGSKYTENHIFKAQAAAWMSWQATPGQGLQQAVKERLIDMEKDLPRRMSTWLKQIFP